MLIEFHHFLENPIASVILVTYNQEDTISQTIDSVLNQRCNFPYEIVIGEDCGTDTTRAICIEYQQKYPTQIKLILAERNGGVLKNYINCVKECSGKYLTGCAGDDYWHNPNKLQIQVDFMESHTTCGILYTDYDELNTETGRLKKSCRKESTQPILQGFRQKEIFDGSLAITAPTICFRKKLIDQYVDFDTFIALEFPVEDWPILIILSKYSEVNYLPISTVTYRKGHESLSNLKSYEKIISKYKREKIMYKYLCDLFPADLPFDETVYDTYVNNILLGLAYKKFDFKTAQKTALTLVKHGDKSIRVKSALNLISFYIFGFLKKIN